MSLSRRVPPKFDMMTAAKPPKVANNASCELSSTWVPIANSEGMTSRARTARKAAADDHAGRRFASPSRTRSSEKKGGRTAATSAMHRSTAKS